ncbi:ImmA/IrrE family metallo-endopeptidase [Candidatus Foliamicus sp.]
MSKVHVNPAILRWARETAGLEPEEAAKKIALGRTKASTPAERLQQLETGETAPTRALLVRMAKQYRRPLLTFYLSNVPQKGDRGNDYRTLPSGYDPRDDALLDALIRSVGARQSLLRAALEDEEEGNELAFIGSKTTNNGVQAVVESIRQALPITLEEFRKAQGGAGEAFRELRKAVESIGVYVVLAGNLGSYHTAIELRTFRGFALSDPVAPFVVINDQDAQTAWSFTLLHELAHLWLGQTGVSADAADSTIEQFCNDVAGEFLLPENELRQLRLPDIDNEDSISDAVTIFANERNLSRSMVTYKLYRAQRIHRNIWQRLSTRFRDEWLENREVRRERARGQEGGANFYTVRHHRLGGGLIHVVQRMMRAGALTTTKAGMVLGVKAKQVQNLLSVGKASRAA